MAKTRMNNAHREVLKEFAYKKIDEVIDRKQEKKLYDKLLEIANTAIRKKYPESEMALLRKYELTQHDSCIKFTFPTGRVNGFQAKSPYINGETKYDIADIPYTRGCGNRDVYPMPEKVENLLHEYETTCTTNNKLLQEKRRDCNSLIEYAKYIEDVLEVIKVPADIEGKLLAKSTALVALSPDVIARIQADFSA